MKKNIIFAAFAAATALLFSTSCNKQDVVQAVSEAKTFTASIENVQAKTSLGTYREQNVIFWDNRDSIRINKETVYSAEPNSERPMIAQFLPAGGPEPKAPYEAIFPASLYVNNNYMQAYCFPQVQKYRAGKFNAPMYAYDEHESLIFQNICGVIRFSLKGTEKIKSIEVSSQSKYLHGAFKVVEEYGGYAAVIDPSAGEFYDYNRTVTLDCGEDGVQLSREDSTDFFIYIPENEFAAEDLSVLITTTNGKVCKKTAYNAVTVEKNTVYTFNWEVEPDLLQTLANFFKGLAEDQAKLAAATDEAMKPMSAVEMDVIKNNPQKFFLPEIHTWKNAHSAIKMIDNSLKQLESEDLIESERNQKKGELCFFRAFLYFELFKTYGCALSEGDGYQNPIPAQYIFQEITMSAETANNLLPTSYNESKLIALDDVVDVTRPTKYAASALLARTNLYASSPLFNLANDYRIIQKYCDVIIKELELAPDYSSLWGDNAFSSTELIFGIRFKTPNTVYNELRPTQSLVDQYQYTKDTPGGKFGDVHNNEPIIVNDDLFSCIDPRFTSTIKIPSSIAGYSQTKQLDKVIPIFRLPEIYLNYAKALNEIDDRQGALQQINLLLNRSNIEKLDSTGYNDKEKLNERIEQERYVEFAFEGHRFWDVRRMVMGKVSFQKIFVANFEVGDNGLQFTRYPIIGLPWSDEYNFYPVPQK